MFPHGGTYVPPTPLEQVQEFFENLDPMALLLAGSAVMIIFMLVVALTHEEER